MTATRGIDIDALISDRSRAIDASGIRRVFELGARLKNPYNFSIGQPDFPVPESMKDAMVEAVCADRNGYTVTQGIAPLLERISRHLLDDIGWTTPSDELGLIVTSGTSGALLLAFMALMGPGDEAIVADPYFVMYAHLGTLTDSRIVLCDTYPDGRLTAERVERLISPRTKILLVNTPANPTGVVLSNEELRDLVDLCERHNIVLISDEIYDVFTFSDALVDGRSPSPARFTDRILLIRGLGKSYGCTGWRLGYTAGPRRLIEEIAKLQQYTFVCAPSPAQYGAIPAFDIDMSTHVRAYERKRDMVTEALGEVTTLFPPRGAFYAFVEVPQRLGLSGSQFAERAIERNVLIIPGKTFSRRDTHFRLSFAVPDERLEGGLAILRGMMAE